MTRTRATFLAGSVALAAAAGVVILPGPRAAGDIEEVPLIEGAALHPAALSPVPPDCRALIADGGTEPNEGHAASALGASLLAAMQAGSITSYHVDVVSTAGGQVTDCLVSVYLDDEQRRAWPTTSQRFDLRGRNIDGRLRNLPARYKRGTSRLSTIAGVDPEAAEVEDEGKGRAVER